MNLTPKGSFKFSLNQLGKKFWVAPDNYILYNKGNSQKLYTKKNDNDNSFISYNLITLLQLL